MVSMTSFNEKVSDRLACRLTSGRSSSWMVSAPGSPCFTDATSFVMVWPNESNTFSSQPQSRRCEACPVGSYRCNIRRHGRCQPPTRAEIRAVRRALPRRLSYRDPSCHRVTATCHTMRAAFLFLALMSTVGALVHGGMHRYSTVRDFGPLGCQSLILRTPSPLPGSTGRQATKGAVTEEPGHSSPRGEHSRRGGNKHVKHRSLLRQVSTRLTPVHTLLSGRRWRSSRTRSPPPSGASSQMACSSPGCPLFWTRASKRASAS